MGVRIARNFPFNGQISENLETSNIILILVSHYFLASDYCYDIEMQRALDKHEKNEARLIPIILNPCDWKNAPFSKLKALPKDGKPVTKYSNQNDAFLEIVEGIRDVAKYTKSKVGKIQKQNEHKIIHNAKLVPEIKSSNLRIVKEFTDKEKDDFLNDSFEYIANYFENSLDELKKRNEFVDTSFTRIDKNHFQSTIYINGKVKNQCTIFRGEHGFFSGDICYSNELSSKDNSFNEQLSIIDDGYSIFLKPLGMAIINRLPDEENLTMQGASEFYWSILINPLQ